jgi:ABC-type sugar transport system ATPase subunit
MTPDSRAFGADAVTHHYSGVVVLRDVTFELQPGEVHALVGENGSGKSTLIKILTGAQKPSRGELHLDGERLVLGSPSEARRRGIGVVHQDYHLFPDLSVAENILGVSQPPPRRQWTLAMDKRAIDRTVRALLDELSIRINPSTMVRALGPAERKFVEIARAMLAKPSFLILDEPTASLEPSASRTVLDLLRRLRGQGVGLSFVSHRLDEVMAISDRITVLRDGRVAGRARAAEITASDLAEMITGRETVRQPGAAPRASTNGSPVIRVSGVRLAQGRAPVDFAIGRGEIFGFTGLLGAGGARLVRMLGGAEPLEGHVEILGQPARIRTPLHASRLGIGFIAEDRKGAGIVPDQSVAVNIALSSLGSMSSFGLLPPSRIERVATDFKQRLNIRTQSIHSLARTLSGGNQQKVLIARWLASGIRILVVEEPTHGVDIGAKAQVHELLRNFAAGGGSIVISSTDVGEVLELCDRIAVMRHGVVAAVLSTKELTRSALTAMGAQDPEELIETLIERGAA